MLCSCFAITYKATGVGPAAVAAETSFIYIGCIVAAEASILLKILQKIPFYF